MAYTVVGDNKVNSSVQIGVSETGVMAATIDGGQTWKETEGGTVENATTQGNVFNGANQLVKLDADAKLPEIDGSKLKGVFTLSDSPLLTGLEGLYRFDDNVQNVLDKNHGTVIGEVSYATGKYGKAIGGFSSVANYVTAALSSDVFTNAFTACGWGYLNDGLDTSHCRILTLANGTSTVFSMTLDNHSTNKSGVYSGDTDTWLRTTSNPSVGSWHHIAATYANGVLKIYLDGVLENQVTTNVAIQTATSLIIGQLWSNPDYKYANSTSSLIDEVGLWNRALTAPELLAIYNSTKPIDLYETFADKTLMTAEEKTKLDNLLDVTTVGEGLSYDAETKTISASNGSGSVIEVTASNTFEVGNVLYKTSNGWALAKSDDITTSEVVGIVTAATAEAFTVTTSGIATIASHGVSSGSTIYLSQDTAGAFTSTEYTSGISLPIGVSIDANTILIDIKRGVNLISDNLVNTVNLITSDTTIYVATTGNDTTGNGTQANPFATITKALSYLQNFRILKASITVTIKLADGTYQIGNTIIWSHMDSNRIWLEGNTSNNTAVKLYKTSGVDPIIATYGYTLKIRYIDFEGNGNKAVLDGNTNVGVMAQSGAYVETYQCIFNNFAHPAIYVIGSAAGMISTTHFSNNYTGPFANVMSSIWLSGLTYASNTGNTSPAINTLGNANSYIYA